MDEFSGQHQLDVTVLKSTRALKESIPLPKNQFSQVTKGLGTAVDLFGLVEVKSPLSSGTFLRKHPSLNIVY